MQIHQIKPIHKQKKRKRVGRGGIKGTYSGRGMKGQGSRATSKSRPRQGFAGGDTLPIKKIPKRRGSKFGPIIKNPRTIVNIGQLNDFFNDNEKVTPQILLEKGLIKKIYGKIPEVKLLGNGQLTKKLLVENCKMSGSVKRILGLALESDKK
ncbi:MAG: 50S ribosomal protein L15 [Patescibacteria group bacterium]